MGEPCYATVEQLQAATDMKTTAYETARLYRILQNASRAIEKRMHRRFYPLTETVEWVLPTPVTLRHVETSGFWLDRDLYTLSSATVDGTAQTVADVELYPSHYGPPYSWIGLVGSSVSVTGVWAYSTDTAAAGALESEISSTTATTVDVTDSSAVGIGDLLTVESERMIVTAKDMLDIGRNLNGGLTADMSDVTVTLDGATPLPVTVGELILVDSERMRVVDVSGNDLTVKRAADGSVLATHTTATDVYAPRSLTVERGAAGTVAATHADATAIVRNVPPAPIVTLCIAEAETTYAQETAGYAREIGSGETAREARGVGLADARAAAAGFQRRRVAAV